jgi:uncharacterized membrane protein YgdD (TMEM256/DUF423 family)
MDWQKFHRWVATVCLVGIVIFSGINLYLIIKG